ncbi:MAG: hypothetical protein FWC91_07555 [Defluviitaleaceae bacterium]|nr:hypothetical protein [Defluviitaleaceae bacterium]
MGTKIFVLQIRDVIRLAGFLLIGLVVLGVLVFLFIPRDGSGSNHQPPPPAAQPAAALYIPGTYVSSIILNDRPLEISVTVTENEIVAVEMAEMYESQRLLYPLFEPIMARVSDDVLFYQRADITIYNDFPVTTEIIQKAVVAALDQAIAH